MSNPQIQHVLKFPEGCFLIVGGSPYFLPEGSDKAYSGYGERKELLGKIHHKLNTRSPDFQTYDLTYEIEDNALISARLITKFQRSAGTLADAATLKNLNDALQNGSLTLEQYKSPPYIEDVAKFSDGRLLVMVFGLGNRSRRLFTGEPGDLKEIVIKSGIQGGCDLYFKTEDGTDIAFKGWRGENRFASYGDRILTLMPVKNKEDLDAYGIKQDNKGPHLDPFCPELKGPQP